MSMGNEILAKLWQRGKEFLGTENAIMGGAMSWVSEHRLTAAISNAKGFGVIACGSMSPEMLQQEIIATQKLTTQPFGVNLILIHPQLQELIEVCLNLKVTHIVLAGGFPTKAVIDRIHSQNTKTICFASSLSIAKRLLRYGVQSLIIEGMEAGGHIGPVSTTILAQEILPILKNDIPIFIAGGIATGEIIVSYLELGASGCQIGTLFVCAHESIAHKNFKKAFLNARDRDTVVSIQLSPDLPVIPVRSIANKATDEFMNKQRKIVAAYQQGVLDKEAAQLEIEKFWAGALKKAVIDGDVEYGSLMAGQSVGMVTKESSVQEVINNLITQAVTYIENK